MSITAHVTALLPVMLAVGGRFRHRPAAVRAAAVPDAGHHGHPQAVCHGAEPGLLRLGLPAGKDYWRLGAVFGLVMLAAFLAVTVPWLALTR
jgi:L-tartrate/succinate antiporter